MNLGFNAVTRLIEYVKEHKRHGTYVTLDVHNLGGLTEYLESTLGKEEGRKKADAHFGVIASILRKSVADTTPEHGTIDFFRYEDDELGFISTEPIDAVENAVYRAVIAIAKYEKDNDLDSIEHRRNSVLGGGFGLSYAAMPVDGNYSAGEIFTLSDVNISLVKMGIVVPYSGSSRLVSIIKQNPISN